MPEDTVKKRKPGTAISLFEHLIKNSNNKQLAKQFEVSISTIARWKAVFLENKENLTRNGKRRKRSDGTSDDFDDNDKMYKDLKILKRENRSLKAQLESTPDSQNQKMAKLERVIRDNYSKRLGYEQDGKYSISRAAYLAGKTPDEVKAIRKDHGIKGSTLHRSNERNIALYDDNDIEKFQHLEPSSITTKEIMNKLQFSKSRFYRFLKFIKCLENIEPNKSRFQSLITLLSNHKANEVYRIPRAMLEDLDILKKQFEMYGDGRKRNAIRWQ